MNKLQSSIGSILLAFVAAAILASAAQADRPDDRAGLLGVGGAAAGEMIKSDAIRPDDKAGRRGVWGAGHVAVTAPDLIERAVGVRLDETPVRPDDRGGPRPVALPEPTVLPINVPGDGFQWRDATVGGGATFVLLLMAALALTIRHRRRIALS